MKTRSIRDAAGRLIGRIDETEREELGHDATGRLVGRYDKKTDKTHDAAGRLVSQSGNVLSSLLFGKKK